MSPIPYTQSDRHIGARRMDRDQERDFLADVQARLQAIAEPGFVESEWERFCSDRPRAYLATALMFSSNRLHKDKLFRLLNRRGLMQRLLYCQEALLALTNTIRCEAHREALITVLENAALKKE